MKCVTEELDLYSLGALPPADRARVAAHLVECPACREQARAIDEVVQELPETLPDREAPGRLRERILASARADLVAARAPVRDTAWVSRLIRPALGLAAALWIAGGAAAPAANPRGRHARSGARRCARPPPPCRRPRPARRLPRAAPAGRSSCA